MANPQLTPEEQKKKQIESLDAFVQDILSENWDKDTRKTFLFIKRTLNQYHLYGKLQESDICIDCYVRVRKKIESGEWIKNMPAYFNRVCFNIVREHSKEQKKTEDLCNRLVHNCFGVSQTNGQKYSLNYGDNSVLLKSLAALNDENREIIELRIVEELSWKEISDHIRKYRNKELPVDSLRKRGERTLKRLREAYGLEAGGK